MVKKISATKRHRKGMQAALAEAEKAREIAANSYAMGAAMCSTGNIVSTGHNHMAKTHPKGSGHSCTVHAEVAAISDLTRWLFNKERQPKLVCYVARVLSSRRTGPARPCRDCLHKLAKLGIREIVFTDYDEQWGIEAI